MLNHGSGLSRRFLMVKRRAPAGSKPGALIIDPKAPKPIIRMISYDETGIDDFSILDIEMLAGKMTQNRKITWIDVTGLGDAGVLHEIGEIFGIHGLALEDVMNVDQRPKVEEHPDHTFIIVQMSESKLEFTPEQFAVFIGANFVLSFQEKIGDSFDMVRARLSQEHNRIRGEGADYLAYALIDSVTDSYFPILENYGESIEALEDKILKGSDLSAMQELHAIRRKLMLIRRAIWPLREVLNTLTREHSPFISAQTQIYFRDASDHCFQLIDIVDTARELVGSISDLYHSGASVRMNEIMTVLTIIATIFIPLGFIASLYGMNFDREVSPWNMPELGWRYGYMFSLSLMAATALGLCAYFWRKGWIGPKKR
ncbi:MAG: magnesium/cobalt transporter CorA [Alphaproteobacteria bacterium]